MRKFLIIAAVGALLCLALVPRILSVRSGWQTADEIERRQDLATMPGLPGETHSPEIAGVAAAWPLPTDGTHTIEVQIGSCDSLEFVAGGYGPPTELVLVDPSGRTASADPNDTVKTELAEMGEFSMTKRWVRSPAPGAWTVTMIGRARGMLWAYEHGGVIVLVNQPGPLAPRETQRVEVFTQHEGKPIEGLVVSATLVNPIGQKSEHVLVDDGTNGDHDAGDGLYTVTIPGNDVEGIYLVDVWAQGIAGGTTVNRITSATYQVRTLPDVAIVPGGAAIRPTAEAGIYSAEVILTNVGNGAAEDVGVHFRDLATGLPIKKPRVDYLAPCDTITVSVTWDPGPYQRDSLRVEIILWSGRDYVPDNNGAVATLALTNEQQPH